MEPILLYCLLNLSGFLFFLIVWNFIPKPKPFDYTTIPGLKLDLSDENDIPLLSIPPSTLIAEQALKSEKLSIRNGNLDELHRLGSFQVFLERNRILFGPLHSFWWSVRYVVVASSLPLVDQLRTYSQYLLAISPLSIGSILQGDVNVWSVVPSSSIIISRPSLSSPTSFDPDLQLEIASRGPFLSQLVEVEAETEVEQLRRVVRQVKSIIVSKGVQGLAYPLVVAFNKEIELDAHPIPPFIPIIIQTSSILSFHRNPLEEYCNTFQFLPGMEQLNTLLQSS